MQVSGGRGAPGGPAAARLAVLGQQAPRGAVHEAGVVQAAAAALRDGAADQRHGRVGRGARQRVGAGRRAAVHVLRVHREGLVGVGAVPHLWQHDQLRAGGRGLLRWRAPLTAPGAATGGGAHRDPQSSIQCTGPAAPHTLRCPF